MTEHPTAVETAMKRSGKGCSQAALVNRLEEATARTDQIDASLQRLDRRLQELEGILRSIDHAERLIVDG